MLNVHVIGGKAEERVPKYFRDGQSVQLSTFVEKKKKKKKLCSDNKEKDQPKISKQENKMAEGMDQCRFCLVTKKGRIPEG